MPAPEPAEAKLDVDVVFLGGVFLPQQLDMIQRNSRGVVQNAADALQKAFLKGFAETLPRPPRMVNLPFVGSYPKRYKALWFPASSGELEDGTKVLGRCFFNLQFFMFFARFTAALCGLRALVRRTGQTMIVVYSAHLPFVVAARVLRWLRPQVHLCVILPDLPEFMGEGGRLYRLAKTLESALFRFVVRGFNSFVLLTDSMRTRLGVPEERCVVIEGIYDPKNEDAVDSNSTEFEDGTFPILYTGHIAARYGIGDLLEAFERLDLPSARLWICGEGDSRALVEEIAARDFRVRYFGQVPRARALALQRQAAVLVNPRRPEEEYTQFSFPSKTLEYLASGTPVLMHSLPGVPCEYHGHFFAIPSDGIDAIVGSLRSIAVLSQHVREERGVLAREFILSKKSPAVQVEKLLRCWMAIEKTKGSSEASSRD